MQSQKMEAIGRLTGGVAHDFNNLLTVVAGNLDLIHHMISGPRGLAMDRLQRLLEGAQRGLARGERLTRQLLAFSRQQPLQVRVVDVNATIEDFRALHPAGVGRDIELQIKLGPGPWMCRLDPAQFEAAILNLALNARDAMEKGGTLSVGTAAPSVDGSAPGVVVTVTDIGTGMAPETIERIFSSRSIRPRTSAKAAASASPRSGVRDAIRRARRSRERAGTRHDLHAAAAAL